MNVLNLLPFLGHSSIYPVLDEFLTRNGIANRPSLKKNVEKDIDVSGTGLIIRFVFDSTKAVEGFETKSEGIFIFKNLYVALIPENKKSGSYLGLLPHGLVAADTRASAEAKLGIPKRRNKNSDNYYLDGMVWIVAFQDDKLRFVEFDLPDNGWREQGICP